METNRNGHAFADMGARPTEFATIAARAGLYQFRKANSPSTSQIFSYVSDAIDWARLNYRWALDAELLALSTGAPVNGH